LTQKNNKTDMPITGITPSPSVFAAAAAATARLQSSQAWNATLTDRVRTNDPSLLHLKLCRKPASLFGEDVAGFLEALGQNKLITTVQFSWRFLSALSVVARIEVLQAIGRVPSLEQLILEAIGPVDALVAALQHAQNLKLLWINSLRLSSNQDVDKLAAALQTHDSLQQVDIYNVKPGVVGTYRVDEEGMVWFQENERLEKIDLNPLLSALSGIRTLTRIQLDLQLNPTKMERILESVLRALCEPPRSFLMLNSCDLHDDDIAVLSEQLSRNENCVEVLNLGRGNSISDVGWNSLAKMMETNLHITALFTAASPGTPEGPMRANDILAELAATTTMTPTTASNSAPSQECVRKLGLYVRLNQKGRKQLLQDSATRREGMEFLIREIDDIDIVFYALQAVPDLFFLL